MIRPARSEDEEIVGQIAYQTGFFGESAERFFPSEALFRQLWVQPYFRRSNPANLVAELDGQVVGYVIGTSNSVQYKVALLLALLSAAGRPWPSTCWRYLARLARYPSPQADNRRYPAHLHLNLLSQARGQGLGRQLLHTHLEIAQAQGIPGVQLSTTSEHRAALHLYRQLGFQVLASRITPLWTPWLGHPAEHLALGRRLGTAGQ